MKIIHIADIHASKERKSAVINIMDYLTKYSVNNNVDYVIIAGDFWDSAVTNTEASGFTQFIDKMKKLSAVTQVRMIYGTQSHEPEGSLDVFNSDTCKVYKSISFVKENDCDFLYIPEPRRSKFISDSKEETVCKIKKYLEQIKNVKKDNKPLIVVYHGEIAGARYQNGIEVTSPIAVTKEFLESTKADYFACGHIHEPQEVFSHCFYSGSAYPINAGETHDAGFYVVEVNNDKTTVQRVSLNFPVNESIEIDIDTVDKLYTKDYSNKNLKVLISCKDRSQITGLEKKIKENTHAHSVRIVPVINAITNIRAKQIIEQKSITDKLKTWAEVNNIDMRRFAIQKAEKLEDSMLIKYSFPSHAFELISVDIHGAIGFSKRKDMKVDFSKYHDGIIVLTGRNGVGKSTFVENCHPYPQMLTRSGKLKDHFNLKDSHRILIYRDETGLFYRISMVMAASIKTGVSKYFVETSTDGKIWQPIPECDGNLDSYQKYVNNTFGSIDLFLKTSFYTKEPCKGYPDIASATKGERMELFAKLSGLDYYSVLCQAAKDKVKEFETLIDAQSSLIQNKDLVLKKIALNGAELEEIESQIPKAESDKQIELVNIRDLQSKQEEYKLYLQKLESSKVITEQFQKSIALNNGLIKDLEVDKAMLVKKEIEADNIKTYTDIIARQLEVEKQVEDISVTIEQYQSELDKKSSEYNELNNNILKKQMNLTVLNKDTDLLKQTVSRLQKTIDNTNICPTCQAKLTKEKAMEIFSATRKEIDDNSHKITENKKEISVIEDYLETNKQTFQNLSSNVSVIKDKISSLLKEKTESKESLNLLKKTRIDFEKKGIKELASFIPRFSEHERKIEGLKLDNIRLKKEIDNQDIIEVKTDFSSELLSCQNKYSNTERNLTELKLRAAVLKEKKDTAKKELDDIAKAEVRININRKDCEDYKILVKAFSNSGIQALELEAIVPDIAEIANRILSKFYGDKFTLSFETLRKGTKNMIEDFNVMVSNSESGRTYPIALLSSGEKVWINLAIEYAFNIVNSQRTGSCFLTRFIDECDGSLDSESRQRYMEMINSAHVEGGAKKTILISHSQEIKTSADQFIEM